MKYGKLTTVGEKYRRLLNNSKWKATFIKAICDCGSGEKEYALNNLRNGHTNSCGCLWIKSVTKHGLIAKNTAIYRAWVHMRERCRNSNTKGYKYYGGRGIFVCDEWLNSFEAFYNWSIANNWRKGLTIDRENNNGNYTPQNCRWVTSKINSQNSRKAILNPIKVNVIRNTFRMGAFTRKELAGIYKVSLQTIDSVINNQSWV